MLAVLMILPHPFCSMYLPSACRGTSQHELQYYVGRKGCLWQAAMDCRWLDVSYYSARQDGGQAAEQCMGRNSLPGSTGRGPLC